MEVHTGMASHIMLFTWIGKEIRMGTCLNTGIEKRKTVLGYNGIVVIASDNLKFTLQILALLMRLLLA